VETTLIYPSRGSLCWFVSKSNKIFVCHSLPFSLFFSFFFLSQEIPNLEKKNMKAKANSKPQTQTEQKHKRHFVWLNDAGV
jgi:hypothetical protein